MLVEIPLNDEERAAVDGDQTAVDGLINQLTDVATPAGPTPNQLAAPPEAQGTSPQGRASVRNPIPGDDA